MRAAETVACRAHSPRQEKTPPPAWPEIDLDLVVAAGGGAGFQRLLGDVKALYFENRGGPHPRRRRISRRDFALFARKQGEIIIFPEDRGNIRPAFVTSGPQVHHERDAIVQIFYCDSSCIRLRVFF